jgi:hypothetical protein
MKKNLLFVILNICFFLGNSQVHFDYTLKTFTEKEGLPDHSLRDIFFDQIGQMWLTTTSSGISVFNGKSFNSVGTESGLSNNMTFRSSQSKDGSIWIATKNGISKIDKAGKVDTFLSSSTNNRKSYFTFTLVDGKDNIWAGGFDGLYKWEGINFKKQNIPKVNRVLFGTNKNGVTYFATDAGLLTMRGSKISLYDSAHGVESKNIYRIFPINEHRVLIGGFDGFFEFDPILKKSKRIITDKGENTSALAIEQINESEFLISSGANNLFLYNGKILSEIDVNLNDPVVDIKKDQFGTIYMAGKYLYQFKKNFFTKKESLPSKVAGFTNYLLYENDIKVAYKDSICYVFKGAKELNKIQLSDEIITATNYFKGILMLGTNKGAVYNFVNGLLKKVVQPNFVNNQPDIVHTIWSAQDGDVYIGRNYTLLRVIKGTNQLSNINYPDNAGASVFELKSGLNGKILVASSSGLYSLHGSDSILKRIIIPKISGSIVSVVEDKLGFIWFAEDGKGVGRIIGNDSVQYISELNGLPYTDISKLFILKEEPNACYVLHIGGLSKIEFYKKLITRIINLKLGKRGVPEVLQGISITNGSFIVSNDGSYFEKHLEIDTVIHKISYLNALNQGDKTVKSNSWRSISTLDTILLKKGGSQLQLIFNDIANNEESKLYLRYKLINNKSLVSNIQEIGLLSLGYLEPGDYELELSFLESPEGFATVFTKHVKVIVPFLWYQTWYFKSFLFVAFVTVLLLILDKIRKRKFQKKQLYLDNQREKLELENKVLKSQLNPHVVFNLLNNIQSRILFEEKDKAIESISSLSSFLRKTLELSKHEEIYLTEEIAYLKSFIDFRKNELEGLNVIFKDELTGKVIDGKIPSMLWQPLIENALKYCGGDDRVIKIDFTRKDDLLVGKISNSVSSSYYNHNLVIGNGLRLVNERVNLLNKINGLNTAAFEYSINVSSFEASISISLKYISYE